MTSTCHFPLVMCSFFERGQEISHEAWPIKFVFVGTMEFFSFLLEMENSRKAVLRNIHFEKVPPALTGNRTPTTVGKQLLVLVIRQEELRSFLRGKGQELLFGILVTREEYTLRGYIRQRRLYFLPFPMASTFAKTLTDFANHGTGQTKPATRTVKLADVSVADNRPIANVDVRIFAKLREKSALRRA